MTMLAAVRSLYYFVYKSGIFIGLVAQIALLLRQGGICKTDGACAEAVGRTYILPMQVGLMSTIVYRQTHRGSDVLRCLGACCFLAAIEALIRQMRVLVGLPLLVGTTYAQVCISLYMYHRFVFHAHWSLRTRGLDRFLWDFLRANYIMHYFEHHQVSRTKGEMEKLAKLQKVTLTQAEASVKYKDDWLLQEFVKYSDRGITVKSLPGFIGAFIFFLILPTGTLALLRYARGDVLGATIHLVGAGLGMLQTMVHHDKYHADAEALEAYALTSRLGWLWRSAEMRRVVHEHKLHHELGNQNRYFSMVPFDCFFIYPLWPEEHMYPVMKTTVCSVLRWICSKAVAAYQAATGIVEKHRPSANFALVLGAAFGLACHSRLFRATFLVLNFLWVWYVYRTWLASMGPQNSKFPRNHSACASFKARPGTTGVGGGMSVRKSIDEGAEATPAVGGACASTLHDARLEDTRAVHPATCEKAHGSHALDMDHIHVPFFHFLLAYYFLVPNATFLWMGESLKLALRERLQRAGVVAMKPCDYPHIVAKLCLEGMEVINFQRMLFGEGDRRIAAFHWHDISYIQMDATVGRVESFHVLVDVETRRMVEATIDGRVVPAKKALILLWFNTVFGTHVKIHAMANWGIAHHVEDLEVRWMQICTVMYNFFGFTTFTRTITQFWFKTGLTLRCYSNVKLASAHSASTGVPFHGNLRQLSEYSTLVNFMLKVRRKFLAEFARHQADFAGADAEGMFVGTVCHSLDHCMMDENLEDPLWLDVDDAEFGAMAELMRHVRVGFVPDLPGLVFNHRFKLMNHVFYRNVYKYSTSVNPWLADRMDAAIVK
uniref:Fatty acid desaturase domain-containing protein n=1 Tax=Zooxanthella nutricula TaxID=1333877 RepID=A0A7S2K5M5_9DINO|mmetsp:Transcript_42069/g.127095  ORF Transcript_42069/g.127095 Transcript_42069/m.127095 type:complete len:830 (+) Transcript_42069:116-2605(+)